MKNLLFLLFIVLCCLFPSAANNNIVVKLKETAPNNAEIVLRTITDGSTKTVCQISTGANEVTLDGANLPQGVYVVCYVVNSTVVD